MKLNDRVRIIASPYMSEKLQAGRYGYVRNIEGSYLDIETEDHYEEDGDYLWPFVEAEIEVVE